MTEEQIKRDLAVFKQTVVAGARPGPSVTVDQTTIPVETPEGMRLIRLELKQTISVENTEGVVNEHE